MTDAPDEPHAEDGEESVETEALDLTPDEAGALEEVADGVHVWRTGTGHELAPRFGFPNAGVVIDADGATVIDTLMVRSQWRPFAAAVAELAGTVKRVVLTGAQITRVGGTRGFPASAVYGTEPTSGALDLPPPVDAYRAFMPEHGTQWDVLEELGTRKVTHLVTAAAQLTPRIELLPARGSTEGDLLVLVADVDVCFAGDLCTFGARPLGFQADVPAWIEVLDVITELADVIVPGHGPVGGATEVAELRSYLQACSAAARTSTGTSAGTSGRLTAGPWDGWPDARFDAINVQRAALLAAGRDELPEAMLRAMGR